MKRYEVEPIFWKAFTSVIERTVVGIIAQESAERTRQITTEGIRLKAKRGRITARWPAYGYKFVDSNGKVGKPSAILTMRYMSSWPLWYAQSSRKSDWRATHSVKLLPT